MELIKKISSKQAKIGIIGLGYVGLPLIIEFCKAGFSVTGFDADEKKWNSLSRAGAVLNTLILPVCRHVSLPA